MDFLFVFVIFKLFKHSQTKILFHFVVFISNVISINSVWWCVYPPPPPPILEPIQCGFSHKCNGQELELMISKTVWNFIQSMNGKVIRFNVWFPLPCYHYQLFIIEVDCEIFNELHFSILFHFKKFHSQSS